MLIETDGPKITSHYDMDFLGVSNGNEADAGFQKGDPLIYRSGKKMWIVTPSKSPELKVYEVALSE
jgi:hypothetical protein